MSEPQYRVVHVVGEGEGTRAWMPTHRRAAMRWANLLAVRLRQHGWRVGKQGTYRWEATKGVDGTEHVQIIVVEEVQ